MTQRLLVFVVVVLAAGTARTARADAVDTLVKQLQSDSASKNVRLAAAVNLAKQSDQRIILPMVKVLGSDDDAQVRSVAAAALGKLITADTKPVLHDLAVKTLTLASQQDDSDDVKKQAAASLQLITGKAASVGPSKAGGGGGAVSTGGAGGVYVNVGPFTAPDPKIRALIVRTAQKTLTSSEPAWMQTWGTGGVPTRPQLDAKKVAGFYVDGTLNTLTDKDSGSNSTISCKVSMLLTTFPEKSAFGFLEGHASVQASNTASDKALAHQDCVEAVIADLIAHKIVPTIKSKVP
jgi:hypothetical protein